MLLKGLSIAVCVAIVVGLSAATGTTDPMTTSRTEYVYTTAAPGPATLPAPPSGRVVVRQKVVRVPTPQPTQVPNFEESMKAELLGLYNDPVDSEDGKKIGSIFIIALCVFIGLLVISDIPTIIMHIKNFAKRNCAYKCSSKKPYKKDKVVPINHDPPHPQGNQPQQNVNQQQRPNQQGVTMRNQQNRQNQAAATVTNCNQPTNVNQRNQGNRGGAAPVMAAAAATAPAWAPDNAKPNAGADAIVTADPLPAKGSNDPPAWTDRASPAAKKALAPPSMDDDPPPYPGSPLPLATLPVRRPHPRSQRRPFWDPDSPLGPDGLPLQNDGLGAPPRPYSPSEEGPWGY